MLDTIPTVTQELERKTVELLETLVHRSESNRLDKAHLAMIGRALLNITSGIVSSDVSTLCAAVAETAPLPKLKRQFIKSGKILSVFWFPDKAGYLVRTHDATTQEIKLILTKSSEIGIRESELTALFSTLTKSGYLEI